LELVDQDQVDLLAKLLTNGVVLEERQRLGLLVDEVDDAEATLVLLIGLEHVRGGVEDGLHRPAQVVVQAWVAVVGRSCFPHGVAFSLRLLSRGELRQVRPLAPGQLAHAPRERRANALILALGLLRRIDGEVDVAEEALKRFYI